MEEVKFLNEKEFTYYIETDNMITNLYDEKIKKLLNKLKSIKEDIDLYEKLISLSDEEIKNSKDKDDYTVLVNDKDYFINVLTNYKNTLTRYCTVLNQLYIKKNKLDTFVKSINYYNDSIDSINKIIKQYNYDIIYDEKNISDFSMISAFKNSLYSIIYFDYSDINANIDINRLKREYNSLSNIESYYSSYKSNKLKTDDDYKLTDCDGFIFEDKDSNRNSNDYSSNNVIGDLDYIIYCDNLSSKKRIRRKIEKIRRSSKWNKIKKSIKKNIGKVIAGLLVGVTVLGASTINAGYDIKENKDDLSVKVVSTMDSVSSNYIINKTEDTNNHTKVVGTKIKQHSNIDSKNDILKKEVTEEITIGTKVSASPYIYINATDAYNKENSMMPLYPTCDEREVSLIYYKNNSGDTVLISKDNKDKIKELKQLKYDVVAYCLDNVTHNVGEGWYNKDDVKVLAK